MNAEQRQTAADPWTKPIQTWAIGPPLGSYETTSTIAVIIAQLESWYSFYQIQYVVPEPSVVIKHLTGSAVLARITETRVDLVLTLVAMVTRCALAAVLLEADQVTGTSVTTGVSKAHVTLGQDLWITAVC